MGGKTVSANCGKKRERTLRIKKTLLAAVCCFWVGWGVVHAATTDLPIAVKQAMDRDPALVKSYADAAALGDNNQWPAAAQTWQRLLQQSTARYGAGHVMTEIAASGLGDSYRVLGRWSEALPLLERAARSFEKIFGQHVMTADVLSRLAAVYVQ